MKRREFIRLTSVGAASATVLSACGHPENKLIPAFIADEQYVPGVDYWRATSCGLCDEGCGVLVRMREGRPSKIEGNPNHASNRGALCARGQAGLQLLYNPDRIQGPLKRTGERGSRQFTEIAWADAIELLAQQVRSAGHNRPGSIVIATPSPAGVLRAGIHLLRAATGESLVCADDRLEYSYPAEEFLRGDEDAPLFDIANATYILSMGARFLETWHSPMRYSRAYGEFRAQTGTRKFVHAEPRLSLTGTNADQWLPVSPGREAALALAIARVIRRDGLTAQSRTPRFEFLDQVSFEKATQISDIHSETVVTIAREFAAAQRPLALPPDRCNCRRNDPEWIAVQMLNDVVGNGDKPGGVYYQLARLDPIRNLLRSHPRDGAGNKLPRRPNKGSNAAAKPVTTPDRVDLSSCSVLLISNANPAYVAPWTAESIKTVPFIVSFSSFVDETAELADLILPDHTYLERWDLRPVPAPASAPAISTSRPIVAGEVSSKQTADVLLELARALEGGSSNDPQFESAETIVTAAVRQLLSTSTPSDGLDDAVSSVLDRGVWVGSQADEPSTRNAETARNQDIDGKLLSPLLDDAADDGAGGYPLTLISYEPAATGFAEGANIPALQELPDPITGVVWGSWLELNPRTAQEAGIADGDLVELTTSNASIVMTAVACPGIRPDVVAIPAGQGHSALGRYARGRGVNPAVLLRGQSHAPARIGRVGKKGSAIRFGTTQPEHVHLKR